MDALRIILIVLGVVVIVGIYFWDRVQKDELPDRNVSPDDNIEDSPGLVITTKTKFNEDDLVSELADLNHFMGEQDVEAKPEDNFIDEMNVHNNIEDSSYDEGDVERVLSTKDVVESTNETHSIEGEEQQQVKLPAIEHIIVLHVVAKPDKSFSGPDLQGVVSGLGFEFGEMNIFHYQDIDLSGKMKTLFSLANMFEPGYFEKENLDTFTTSGITLFATLKNDGSETHVFDTMLEITNQIAEQLDAVIWGPDKTPLIVETIENFYQKLKEAK